MTYLYGWAGGAVVLLTLGCKVWWFRNGPSRRTRFQIERIVQARGFTLVSVKPKADPRFGQASRALLRAQVRNAFGDVQTIYFDVSPWTDMFSRQPHVRELGGYLGPLVSTDPS